MPAKSSRIKAVALLTREAFLAAVNRIATLTTDLRKLEAQRDAAVQKALQGTAVEITRLQAEISSTATLCEKYAEANRAELLPDEKKKSAETTLARYGYHTGNHKLETLSKFTWKKVLEKLQLLHLVDYIRTKPEVDKERILIDAKKAGMLTINDETAGADVEIPLADVGLKLVQDETFYIEPKAEGADQVKAGGES